MHDIRYLPERERDRDFDRESKERKIIASFV